MLKSIMIRIIFMRIKKIVLNVICGLFSFILFAGCKVKNGSQGSADFSHTVVITGIVCNADGSITLSLLNNSNYTAILAPTYQVGIIQNALSCTDITNGLPTANNTTTTLAPFGSGTATLYLLGTLSGNTFNCTVAPFSEEQGWYDITSQTVTCS